MSCLVSLLSQWSALGTFRIQFMSSRSRYLKLLRRIMPQKCLFLTVEWKEPQVINWDVNINIRDTSSCVTWIPCTLKIFHFCSLSHTHTFMYLSRSCNIRLLTVVSAFFCSIAWKHRQACLIGPVFCPYSYSPGFHLNSFVTLASTSEDPHTLIAWSSNWMSSWLQPLGASKLQFLSGFAAL